MLITAKFKEFIGKSQVKTNLQTAFIHLLFFYPAFFSVCFYFFSTSNLNKNEFYETVLFTLILLLISHLLSSNLLRKAYLLFVLLVIYFSVFIEVAYFYLYHDSISESTVYIVLETNFGEAGDFISMYFDEKVWFIFISLFLPFLLSVYVLIRFFSPKHYFFSYSSLNTIRAGKVAVYSILSVCFLCTTLLMTKLRERNFVYLATESFISYRNEAESFKLLGKDKFGGQFSNVYSDKEREEVYVIIIGESTTRSHMGLYGYYRNTTPLLSKRKDELKVYTDVISPHAHTINSLEKVLTLASAESPNRAKDGSLLQLMNKAGFATYWISNQSPIGADETLVTSLSKASYKSYFTNTAAWTSTTPYDEKVLVPFKQVLAKPGNKKFIVIHLMGTHGKYFRRYPESFNVFKTNPKTVFQNDKAFRLINEYDNANVYNDYIVNSIIELTKNENKAGWVLYFSDHGEDVFETINKATHGDDGGTKPMYDIPFLLWRSAKYKQQDQHHVYDTERKYMTDDLIYTIADLSNVRFTEFDSSRSLVNADYIERERFLWKNGKYEDKFSRK